jgi:16S rRNA (guanine(966)-N(2))-methyltransferase RsmD
MRIIAGQFRGRKLLPPATDATRPVTDRVKQSVFDILAPRLDGARIYDCFAGTGSMGLECLSRGASHATFFESHPPAVKLLKQNIATLGVGGQSTLVTSDLFTLATRPADRAPTTGVIFLDPPYRFLRERPDDLQRLAAALASELVPDGVVVFRHDSADTLALTALSPVDLRQYGSMTVELLRAAR